MKKKVMLDEAGLKALLANKESKAAPEAKDKKPVEATETVENTEVEAAKVDTTEEKDEVAELTAEIEKLKVDAAEIEAKHAEALAAKEKEMEDALAALQAPMKEMQAIISDQISSMRVGLSLTAVDLSDLKPEALIAEFNNICEKFMKAIPVGSLIPEQVEKTEAAMSSLDEAGIRGLGF